jgi:hypothetical protein
MDVAERPTEPEGLPLGVANNRRINFLPQRSIAAFVHASQRQMPLRLSPEENRELQIDKGQVEFESEAAPEFGFPADFDGELVHEFLEGIHRVRGLEEEHGATEILSQRRLGSNYTAYSEDGKTVSIASESAMPISRRQGP